MKTTPLADLDRAPWLAGIQPIEVIRLHPRRGLTSTDPGSSKMGWPFLWPEAEPWPVCTQRDPDMLAAMQAGEERMKQLATDPDAQILMKELGIPSLDPDAHILPGMPSMRETATKLMNRCRDGHNVPYLPVLQLRRSEYPCLPFPGDTDLFQLLWCPMIHFEGTADSCCIGAI